MNKECIATMILAVALLLGCETEPYTQGKLIYEVNCGNCHMTDGKGMGVMYPDITNSEYLSDLRHELPCIIVHGKEGSVMTNVVMPPNDRLTPVAINNLINYMNHKWGDKTQSNMKEVEEQLERCGE